MLKLRRIICLALVMAMFTSVAVFGGVSASASSGITEAGGWFESLYAEWTPVNGADGYNAYYGSEGSWTAIDGQLIRQYDGYYRVDAVGVKAGNYQIKVVPTAGGVEQSSAAMVSETVVVSPYDRSGYAHFNYTEGVGAYNDDGTLKDNAIVLYVTDANKNSVSVTSKDGTTVTGIGNILNSVGQDVGGGKTSKGGIPNTNADIIRKLAKDGTPLVVRIIGSVKAPEGLTAYDSIDYGGSTGDNGFMARMSGGKDITIEGIGFDAELNGWGLHFICQTADYASGIGKSFEVRNLAFRNVPEDCVGMEGQQEGSTLTAPVERCWIHHCTFYAPKIANPAESDKDGGDGACDFKRGQYFTNSYCYYNGYHKTNLVGSSDSSLQYNLTYHHNYWKDCESRGPLARQANIHMYNNIFEGQTSYCMNPRANAYIFSEYNMFYQSKNPVQVKSGAVKSYGDSFASCTGENGATIVTDRATQVSTSNKYANFDTNSSLSYIPSGDYIIQESIPEMRAVVLAYAGRQKENIQSPDEVNTSVIPAAKYPTSAVTLDYTISLNKANIPASGTYDNINYTITKFNAEYLGVGGSADSCNIVFYVGTEVDITLTQYASSSYDAVLCNEHGEALLVGGGTVRVPSGYYFIQSNVFDVGGGKYKEAKITSLTIVATDPNASTNPIPTPPPVVEPDDPNPDNPDNPGTNPDNPGTNPGGTTVPVGSYTHNITESDLSSDFFTLSGATSTSKGTVTFNGLTLTKCLKVSSSAYIKFTAPADGKVTLVFNPSCAGYTLKVNADENLPIPSDGLFTFDVTAGTSYEVKKDKSESFLYYLVYTPNQVHIHEYVAEEITAVGCEVDGEYRYLCDCGDSYTEKVAATGHDFVDGFCVNCGVDDPDYVVDDPTEPEDPTDPDEPDEPDEPDCILPDPPTEEPQEKLNFFQRIWKAIVDFFRRLFGKKDK